MRPCCGQQMPFSGRSSLPRRPLDSAVLEASGGKLSVMSRANGWFTKGFNPADWQEAQVLLQERGCILRETEGVDTADL